MINTDALLRIAWTAAECGNHGLARQCYEQGAALGDAHCIQGLAYMYDVGEGVPEDKTLAMKLYRQAWRRGSHAAATNLAVHYRKQRRYRLMFRWLEKVALAGDGSAQLDMAKSFLAGCGVRKDAQAALRCLAAAVGSEYITEHEREEAKALLTSLAPQPV